MDAIIEGKIRGIYRQASWPAPNLFLLKNALVQTNWNGDLITEENWKQLVWEKLQALNWSGIVEDVRPFVEPSFDLNLLSLDNFGRILKDEFFHGCYNNWSICDNYLFL